MLDLRPFKKTGKDIENLLVQANITVNKNGVPNDPENAFTTSGIRLGTPAVTSRGMDTEDMRIIAKLIVKLIKEGEQAIGEVKAQVLELCSKHPLYANDVM